MLPFSINTDVYAVNTDIEPRLRVFAKAGFKFIHWCEHSQSAHFYTDKEIRQVKELLNRHQIQCLDIHGFFAIEKEVFSLSRWIDLNINRMEFLHALGGNVIVLHISPLESLVIGASELDMARQMIDALLPVSQKLGVRIAVENGSKIGASAHLLHEVFNVYTFDDLGFCFDSGHAQIDNNMNILETFFDRLLLVHLHDNYGTNDDHNLPGQGIIDWKWVIQLVLNAPYLRTLTLEVGLRRLEWIKDAYTRFEKIAGYTG